MPTDSNAKQLLIAPQQVREAIMMQPLVALLERQNPQLQLDAVVSEDVAHVAQAMPQFDDLIVIPNDTAAQLRGLWKLTELLRTRNYGRCYNLDDRAGASFVPWMARIPERRAVGPSEKPHTGRVEQYCQLVSGDFDQMPAALPVPRLVAQPEATQSVELLLDKHFPALSASAARAVPPLIVLSPGATSPSRRWPTRHFARLAAMIRGQWPESRIVLASGAAQRALCTEIAALSATTVLNLAGQLTTAQLIALLHKADIVVCNESDMLHLAAASPTGLIALYGASSPAANPPLTVNAQVHWLDLNCSPCELPVCPLGHTNCMNLLEPVRIFNTVESMVQAERSRPVR